MPGINIIQKQILEVEMSLPGISAFQFQTMTTKWCSEVLVPAINRKLEKYAVSDDVMRLENITIDVKENFESLTDSLAEKIATEIEMFIKSKIGSAGINSNISTVSKQKTTIEAFIFFLQNAYLPWWSHVRSISELNDNILMDMTANELKMLRELLVDTGIRKRLVSAISPGITATVLSIISKKEKHEIEIFLEKIRNLSLMIDDKDLRFQFLTWSKQEYIYNLISDVNEMDLIQTLVKQLIKQYKIREEIIRLEIQQHRILKHEEVEKIFIVIKTDETTNELIAPEESETSRINVLKKKEQKELQKEGIYINNAGLVLVAPFLPRFFENLGIVEDGRFNSKDLALALMQWLVKGKNEYEESELVLPKILCGMEPEEAVIIIPSLPESFKIESDNLLQSVIDHWSILKNTTVNGLRESFLQRNGKLSRYDKEWFLQVEQKPYDMLLEQLPWNISMTKLSWMNCLLKTEWIG